MPLGSNIDDVGDWLDAVIDEIGWDIEAAHGGETLAAAAIDVIADGMQARARVQSGPDGESWPDNKQDYAARKAEVYGEQPPNYRTHQMLSRESLRGRQRVGKLDATWTYGTGAPSSAGRTKHDRTVPDTDKAWYANEIGQSKRGVKREFWGLDEDDPDDVLPIVEDAIAALIERRST